MPSLASRARTGRPIGRSWGEWSATTRTSWRIPTTSSRTWPGRRATGACWPCRWFARVRPSAPSRWRGQRPGPSRIGRSSSSRPSPTRPSSPSRTSDSSRSWRRRTATSPRPWSSRPRPARSCASSPARPPTPSPSSTSSANGPKSCAMPRSASSRASTASCCTSCRFMAWRRRVRTPFGTPSPCARMTRRSRRAQSRRGPSSTSRTFSTMPATSRRAQRGVAAIAAASACRWSARDRSPG